MYPVSLFIERTITASVWSSSVHPVCCEVKATKVCVASYCVDSRVYVGMVIAIKIVDLASTLSHIS